MVYHWIIGNKEILKIIYALIICSIAALITLKTDRLFKISDHQGLRYFRNSFFFYGLAFFTRFILGKAIIPIYKYNGVYQQIILLLFKFFIIMAGFFLLYSLIWKYIEKIKNHHSFFNSRILIFYLLTVSLIFLDFIFSTNIFMYLSQVILFLALSVIAYKNYIKDKGETTFLKYYFITMLLGFIAWILNTVLYCFLKNNSGIIQIFIYGINILFFVFFLFGIIKITDKH